MNAAHPLNKTLLVIVGPTAAGKTTLAIKLAQHFHTEIVSADSRQFYRELNIGTAKPTVEELSVVPHHLINSISIHDEYNTGGFEKDALTHIEEIFTKHNLAILCGGSGLYIDIVCKGSDYMPPKDPEVRAQLNKLFLESGIKVLQEKLLSLDPEFYKQVDLNNPHRIIRALEVCMVSGKKYSELRKGSGSIRPFNILKIGLEEERELIYQRINDRVDVMMQKGLLAEAKALYPNRNLNALQTVGYKELFDYLDNKTTLEQAVNLIKQHSRNYAKRQWTWFRKDKGIQWFKPGDVENIISFMKNTLPYPIFV